MHSNILSILQWGYFIGYGVVRRLLVKIFLFSFSEIEPTLKLGSFGGNQTPNIMQTQGRAYPELRPLHT